MLDPSESPRQHDPIKGFLRYLPGFRGYLEREDRRESDTATRQWLADQLQRAKSVLTPLNQTLADLGQLDLLPQVDRLRARLDKLIARIRGAMRGYSGFFDRVQIDTDALDRVYLHDLDLMQRVDDLVQTIQQLPSSDLQFPNAFPDLHARLAQLDRDWDTREQILRQME